jgi:chromosome segregation ATPase
LVVRDRAGARRLLPSLPADGRVVTLAGEIFYAAGHVVVGRGARRSARREQARGRTEAQLLEARKALADVEAAHARAAAEVELARARVGEAVRVLESALETERETRHAA